MNRRAVISALGGAAVWPLAARAQQPALPVIGYLSIREFEDLRLAAFRQGLREAGYVEGRNVQIEHRQAAGNDQLPEMAADLVRRRVAVIVAAGGTPAALAAKAATATIPIVFGVAVDPVEVGLVASLAHPGGNVTGVTNLNAQVGPKRLELVHELLPGASVFALLVDPTGPALADPVVRDSQAAARTLGVTLHVLHASSDSHLEAALASVAQLRAAALIISPSTFFTARSERLAALTVRHAVPAIFQYRPFAAAGGLLSYGTNETEYYRPIGVYAGRILKGEKPGDLPVQRSSKVELIVNLKTAKALGLTVPLTLLGRADEVIE
jgi:putative ABC transport system substrate-binding protein